MTQKRKERCSVLMEIMCACARAFRASELQRFAVDVRE